jgi:UDP-N-acetylmuramoyl-tripeptide--D-alanyl-D-alanine ligase
MRNMSALWTSSEIAAATGGLTSAAFIASGVAFDSREVGVGDLFIALSGDTTDGHRFIDGAFAKGAAGAIVSVATHHPHILVEDTAAALNALGVASRTRSAAKIVGVTGSVGKTGTKEALANALARANVGPVHRSVKSYNNHTGVPLSLARMHADTRFGVFEMGMNHAGELAALTQLVRPHVALVTTVASAHREFFASEDAIADAKGEIFAGLEAGGTAIIPFDNVHRDRLIAAAKPYATNIITFGLSAGADVRALDVVEVDGGTMVTATLPGADLCFTVSQPGAHWVSNALAVMAAVQAMGGDLAAAGLALADFGGLAGRGAQHQIAVAGGHAILIDESYNANPTSMAATLAVLGATEAKRRVAVLGEMRELGPEGAMLHAGLAAPIMAANVDFALLIGAAMAPLAAALDGKVKCAHVPDASTALDLLQQDIRAGDVVLIKGSNAIGLSRLVDVISGGGQ